MENGMYFDKPFGVRVFADGAEVASLCSDAFDRIVYSSDGAEPKVFGDFFSAPVAIEKLADDVATARTWAKAVTVIDIDGAVVDLEQLSTRFHEDRHAWQAWDYVSYSHWFE